MLDLALVQVMLYGSLAFKQTPEVRFVQWLDLQPRFLSQLPSGWELLVAMLSHT